MQMFACIIIKHIPLIKKQVWLVIQNQLAQVHSELHTFSCIN